jgi:HK97 gp10 family phage protein
MARRLVSSMFSISLDLQGDAEVAAAFTQAGSLVRARVKSALEDLGNELVASEKSNFHTKGGTGRTRDSIGMEAEDTAEGIIVRVGPDGTGWRAIFKEKGVRGPVTVRRFARGKRGGYVRKMVLTKRGSRRRIKVVLGTFKRNVQISPQPFVKPAWDSVRGRVKAAIEGAIEVVRKETGF